MKSISIKCPGKVNLFLDVTGKRDDGYHLIDSLFLPIHDIADTLNVSITEEPGISINCSNPGVPCSNSNLIWKAAEAFACAANINPCWHFDLEKKIPVAGGMGGGSSNAASTFMALNEIYNYPLSKESMQELSLGIGADLPFFFEKKPSLVNGIGEIIKPVPVNIDLYILFVPLKFPIPAVWAYKNRPKAFSQTAIDAERYLILLNQGHYPKGYNDLESAVKQKFPIINEVCKELLSLGAYTANVSGSGPTCFALFKTRKARDHAQKNLQVPSLPATYS